MWSRRGTRRKEMGTGRGAPSSRWGSSPLGRALKLFVHRRTFLQAVSSEKVRSTNLNCSVIVDVRHDGSEPCVDVLFGDGHRLIMRGTHLTAQEMLTAFASHIQARAAAGSGDKPSAGTGR
ncbi:39S ribosomal protein L53, mitochondrial isoform X1 [Suricata suricatta]|uniref:39S ribosomal protein L53, mitochondrial isoform X1 n=1 Tax=Suricata suricatta TaxID=37032 RepID=UPI001155BD3E|nr:39S ribosomal protein L53, mitochondrial isoform X1 [Suricata suricatta]